MEGWRAEQQRQQTNAWSPGQQILNDTGARVPEHTFHQPVPIAARIVWEHDGEEHDDTVALGWTGRDVYVRTTEMRSNERVTARCSAVDAGDYRGSRWPWSMARVGTSVVALAGCRGLLYQANDGTRVAQVAGSGGGRVRGRWAEDCWRRYGGDPCGAPSSLLTRILFGSLVLDA